MKKLIVSLLMGMLIGCAGGDDETPAWMAQYGHFVSVPGSGFDVPNSTGIRGLSVSPQAVRPLIPEPEFCPDNFDLYAPVIGGVYQWLCCPAGMDVAACAALYCQGQEGIPNRNECGVCEPGKGIAEVEEAEIMLAPGEEPLRTANRVAVAPGDSQIIVCPVGQKVDQVNCICIDEREEPLPVPLACVAILEDDVPVARECEVPNPGGVNPPAGGPGGGGGEVPFGCPGADNLGCNHSSGDACRKPNGSQGTCQSGYMGCGCL